MARLSHLLRSMTGGCVGFWCPGCDEPHIIRVEGAGAWGYNGNAEAPTFTPSVKVTWQGQRDGREATDICHSFVTDGRIQFLGDCTHALANQTVPLADWPDDFDDGSPTAPRSGETK